MILQKLADAIREQNWSTVVVEVLIVVIGIFIGLQVDGWKQDREDRAAEQRYLQRLQVELIENRDVSRGLALSHENRARIALELRGYLLGERGEAPSIADLWMSLCRWHIHPASRLRTATYDELESTGNLALIRDLATRELLLEASAEHDTIRRQIDLFGTTVRDLMASLGPHIEWYPRGDEPLPDDMAELSVGNLRVSTLCRFDVERMKAVEHIGSILAQLYRSQIIFADFRRREMRADQQVLDRLAEIGGAGDNE